MMLELVLTTNCCKEIVRHMLEKRGWTIARIARTIGATRDYVHRIQTKKQSFQVSDVESLAKAVGVRPAILVFESMRRDELSSKGRELYDMVLEQIELFEGHNPKTVRKPTKKRRVARNAA